MWMSIAKGARYACCDNVTFRAMVMQGDHPALPVAQPQQLARGGAQRGHRRRHHGARRGAGAALARLRARSPSEAGGVMVDLIWDAGCRLGEWWNTLPERVRSVVCAVVMLVLIAVAGAIEGTAPSGMYY